MANPEHLAKLKEGVEAWNEWREENPTIKPDLSWAHLVDADLDGADLSEADLTRAELVGAKLRRANLTGADLRVANLEVANLTGAHLYGTNLQHAELLRTNLTRAQLYKADLVCARLWETDLTKANLMGANLDGASLANTNLSAANLRQVKLKGSILRRRRANLHGAIFRQADVREIEFNRWVRYRGVRIMDCFGSPRFIRFARDQEFIEEFRGKWWRFPIYLLWLILADCGRSLALWAAWSLAFVTVFALFYTPSQNGIPKWIDGVIPDSVHERIQAYGAEFEQTPNAYKDTSIDFDAAIYFSVVTFTTLGFGDIVAANEKARFLVTLEVIIGYVMLGGLISIFATKLARRS